MKIRKGIVLKNICDTWLLIAVGEASEHCMYVREINDTLAWYVQEIEQNRTKEEIIKDAQETFEAPEEIIRKDLDKLISDLYAMNYLVEEPEQ
ncbi:MAG: PqqD family protein [Solobacterium sp.]|nr:PqqD family protein [Solobacterium sp.]